MFTKYYSTYYFYRAFYECILVAEHIWSPSLQLNRVSIELFSLSLYIYIYTHKLYTTIHYMIDHTFIYRCAYILCMYT